MPKQVKKQRAKNYIRANYSELIELIETLDRPLTTREAIQHVPLYKDSLEVAGEIYPNYVKRMKKRGYETDEVLTRGEFLKAFELYFGRRVRAFLRKRTTNTKQADTFVLGQWKKEVDKETYLNVLRRKTKELLRFVDKLVILEILTPREGEYLKQLLTGGLELAKTIALRKLKEKAQEALSKAS